MKDTLDSFDIDNLVYDIKDISIAIANSCNKAKRKCSSDEKSKAYDELENYFRKLECFINVNSSIIASNIVNVPDIHIMKSNCFCKFLK